MKPTLPVNLILGMWEYGCTASAIAHALGIASFKTVAKVVDQARAMRDPRAVLHAYQDGRDLGRAARAQIVRDRHPGIKTVAIVKNVSICTRGHRLNKRNTYVVAATGQRQCKVCAKLRVKESRLAKRVRCIDADATV